MTDLVPAAQYLRMSTEHQQYSLQNQATAIQQYAEFNGFEIVRTYADAARSGVVLKRRLGLQQLLRDVIAQTPSFRAILVYDVSRWGRFQDMDEAAHYEFLCKSARIPVHYCSETFSNDGTLPSLIMKALKRTMAGEYSRELSAKVTAGQARLAKLGFKQGGSPGYGLRRMLVTPDREPKHKLGSGERKSLATDRVVLVPGPKREVKVVREIYRMLIYDGIPPSRIAGELNRKGIEYSPGSTWDKAAVYSVLTQLKYIGCEVYGRTSSKLYTPTVHLPQTAWIVKPKAFEPIIDYPIFAQAQHILYRRSISKPNEQVLSALKSLLAQHGRLSGRLIDGSEITPSQSLYKARFGSLKRTYDLIGYGHSSQFGPVDVRRRTQALREELVAQLLELFPNDLTVSKPGGKWRSQIRLRGGQPVSVLMVRSRICKDTTLRWVLKPVPYEQRHPTLMARLNKENRAAMDFHILPNLEGVTSIHLREKDPWLRRGVQLSALADLLNVVRRLT